MPEKILHIIIKSRYDGVTSFAIRLINALPQYDHSILACYKGNANNEINEMKIRCAHLLNQEQISYKTLLLKYFSAIHFFMNNRFDIIHYHHGGIGVLLIAVLFGKKAKVIHHLHGGNLIGDNTKQEISFIHLMLLKLLSKFTYQIAVAKHVYDEYELKVKRTDRLQLIRNTTPHYFSKQELKKKALGYIGRFEKNKGYPVFLSIASEIKSECVDLNFFAIGDVQNNQYDFINFLLPTFKVEQFYSKIDLLLFTSKAPESLPLVVLEAIAFDVGVIAYPLKGVVEILGDDYPLYYYNNYELINRVKHFYSDTFDRQNLSGLHQKRVEEFKFEEMINKINLLYDSHPNRK